MSHFQRNLDRAKEVTQKLAEAEKDFLKIAVILAQELLPLFSWDFSATTRITKKPEHIPGEIRVPARLNRNGDGRHGFLRSLHSIHDLIADLLAERVCPPPTPGNNKREISYSYPFYLGALSALAHRSELPEALLQLCEAGRDKAGSMAMAAVFYARPEILGEIQQGMSATEGMEYKHDTFSNHVVAVRTAYRELVEKKVDEPFKADVQKAAIKHLKKQGLHTYEETDSGRWREIYKTAGLSNLKQKRGNG